MAKKRKNSNYVTAKTEQAKRERELAEKRKKTKKTVTTVLIALVVCIVIAGIVLGIGYAAGWFGLNFKATHHATIEIENYGTVHIELYGENAPVTVNNFVKLANEGFYDGLTFHRIMEGFMAQGGDPNGNGSGGSGTNIKGEFANNGVQNDIPHIRGTISMARSDPYDSASSQFFIVHKTSANNSKSLDGKYAAFGMVTDGMDVIDEICEKAEPSDANGMIPKSKQPIIKSITIHEVH